MLAVSQKARFAILFCHRFVEGPQAFRVIKKRFSHFGGRVLFLILKSALTSRLICLNFFWSSRFHFFTAVLTLFLTLSNYRNSWSIQGCSFTFRALLLECVGRQPWEIHETGWEAKRLYRFPQNVNPSQLDWVHFWGLTGQLSRNNILVVWLGDFLRFARQCKIWWVNGLTPKYRKILRC